jgi:hypothetical protein
MADDDDYRDPCDGRGRHSAVAATCGLVIAFAMRAFHNSSLLTPVQMTAVILVGTPGLLAVAFLAKRAGMTHWPSAMALITAVRAATKPQEDVVCERVGTDGDYV